MQPCSSGLCGASEDFWFLSLLLPCDLYAAVLKKTIICTGIVGGKIFSHEGNRLSWCECTF